MTKRIILALVCLIAPAIARAQTATVSGNLKDVGANNATGSNSFVRFILQNYVGIPLVSGTNAVVTASKDFHPDGSGNISGSIQENSSITASGQTGLTFYQVCVYYQGQQFKCNTYTINANFNLSTATPMNQSALPLPPNMIGLTANRPALCTIGQVYFATDAATPGQNLYFCTSTNTWTIQPAGSQGPAGPQGPAGATGATGTISSNSGATIGGNAILKGPIPFADLSAFTRAAYNSNGCGTTATISIGSPTTATLASGACFQNGDGITIYGAGAAVSFSSPSAPTVTPNTLSVGGTGLGGGNYSPVTIVNGATGSSTYSYILVARDPQGGFAAPSSATTITNGPSTLGSFSCTISSESRSARSLTVNFSSACAGAVVGAAMLITGTVPNPPVVLSGFYNIQTVNSSTQVVVTGPFDSTGFGWNNADSKGTNSSTGGTAYFINSNHLRWTYATGVWEYYICAERPGDGSYHRIGVTKPSTATYEDIQFDDYGSTMMATQPYPAYITDTVCNGASGQNDPLTASITAGGGTTTVTLDTAASNGVTGATAIFDNGPGFLKAAQSVATTNSIPGELFIPPTTGSDVFLINSYVSLPSNLKIRQAGHVTLNETVNIPSGNVVWDGSASLVCGFPQFGLFTTGGGCLTTQFSNPGILIGGDGVSIGNLTLSTSGNVNGGTGIVIDASHSSLNNLQFIYGGGGGTNTDFLSTAIVIRGDTASNDAKYIINKITYLGATYTAPAASWTPILHIPNAQNGSGSIVNNQALIDFTNVSVNQRGIVQYGSGISWNLEGINRQSGVMPFLWHLNGNSAAQTIKLRNILLDTDGASVVSEGSNDGIPTRTPDYVDGIDVGGGAGLLFGGYGPVSSRLAYSGNVGDITPNQAGVIQGCELTNAIVLNCNFESNAYIGPNASTFYPLAAPAAPTLSVQAGGGLASGNFQALISAVGVDGKETIASAYSTAGTTSGTCPGSGNCEFSVTWTAVPYAASYRVYGCGPAFPACPSLSLQATGVTTNSYTWTTLAANGTNPIIATLSGQSGLNSTTSWAPYFMSPEGSAPSGQGNVDQLYGDSTAHRFKQCNNNGSCGLVGFVICSQVAIALRTSLISSATTDSAATGTCTGLTTSDSITCTFSGDPTSTTGFTASTSGVLATYVYPTSNTINIKYQNNTSSSITPGAVTANCMAVR